MTYHLRDIPVALWRKVKMKAASDGVTIRQVLFKLLTEWVR